MDRKAGLGDNELSFYHIKFEVNIGISYGIVKQTV